MATGGSSFDWFTGRTGVAAPCPTALVARGGLQRFYQAPNAAAFGAAVPRRLMHESLHAFQLAGSTWLQRMVAEEWERVLAFERTGARPPRGSLESSYNRPAPGMPYAVGDLVECLARFWDMHIRGPDRILAEEGFPDPDGRVARVQAERRAHGGQADYSSVEYEAAMEAGKDRDRYVKPYRWLLGAAADSPAVKAVDGGDPQRNANWASWAVNVILPVAGFVALNTADPVRAFVVCADEVLGDPTGLILPTAAENAESIIQLDQLTCWAPLVERMAGALKAAGLPADVRPRGIGDREGWASHPVWRHHAARCEAFWGTLQAALTRPLDDDAAPSARLTWNVVKHVMSRHAFSAFGLPGEPGLRALLGITFAPPLVEFTDGTRLPATEACVASAPWPADGAELTAAVDEAVRRYDAVKPRWTDALGIAPIDFSTV